MYLSSIHPFMYLSIYLSVDLIIYLSVSLSLSMHIHNQYQQISQYTSPHAYQRLRLSYKDGACAGRNVAEASKTDPLLRVANWLVLIFPFYNAAGRNVRQKGKEPAGWISTTANMFLGPPPTSGFSWFGVFTSLWGSKKTSRTTDPLFPKELSAMSTTADILSRERRFS